MADYSLVPQMPAEIQAFMDDYFDTMYSQNMETFDRVFHPSCCLYSAQGGSLNLRPFDVYREAVLNRESPESRAEKRLDRVLMFDQISDTLALVKPELRMMGGVMQDYLNLVKLDGKWWVMAKMWERVADAD